jgi:hypothetical protein
MPECDEARTCGRQSTFRGAFGLKEGYEMGFSQGFEDGHGLAEIRGQAWETGSGYGLFFGGHEDHFDD